MIQIRMFEEIEQFFFHFSEEFSSPNVNSEQLTTDKLKYPRGIINPNYPGFQHLAHTLSEHFVDHHRSHSNMSDSDFSEVESDLPSENATQSSEEQENNNNNPFLDDSNGNSIEEVSSSISSSAEDNLSKVEEILRTVFESNSTHLMTAIELFSEKEIFSDQTFFDDEEDELNFDEETDEIIKGMDSCDLKTYLKHYDDAASIEINAVESIFKKQDESQPDIIQKSTSSDRGFDTSIDKPDILLDVTGDVGLKPGNTLTVEKDQPGSNWSITPVDIVGNFEQEVEREFGLLVTGYKSNGNGNGNSTGSEDEGIADIMENPDDVKSSNETIFDKVS